MHLALPQPRDNVPRPPQIPESVLAGTHQKEIFEGRQKDWEHQQELYYEMDPDFVGIQHQKRYLLENPAWNFDKIPEIMDGEFSVYVRSNSIGKNILDFYDPDILEKLEKVEREELIRLRKLEAELEHEAQLNKNFELTPEQKDKLRRIREKRGELIAAGRRKKTKEGANLPRPAPVVSKFPINLSKLKSELLMN